MLFRLFSAIYLEVSEMLKLLGNLTGNGIKFFFKDALYLECMRFMWLKFCLSLRASTIVCQ